MGETYIPQPKRLIPKAKSLWRSQITHSKIKPWKTPTYDREEFLDWLFLETNYLNLWERWREAGWDTKLAPSVDRRDNTRGYELDNLQLMTG